MNRDRDMDWGKGRDKHRHYQWSRLAVGLKDIKLMKQLFSLQNSIFKRRSNIISSLLNVKFESNRLTMLLLKYKMSDHLKMSDDLIMTGSVLLYSCFVDQGLVQTGHSCAQTWGMFFFLFFFCAPKRIFLSSLYSVWVWRRESNPQHSSVYLAL